MQKAWLASITMKFLITDQQPIIIEKMKAWLASITDEVLDQ